MIGFDIMLMLNEWKSWRWNIFFGTGNCRRHGNYTNYTCQVRLVLTNLWLHSFVCYVILIVRFLIFWTKTNISFYVEVHCSLGRPHFSLSQTYCCVPGGGDNVELRWNCCVDVSFQKPYFSLAQMSTSLLVPRLWWQQGAWWQPFKGFISKPKMLPCPPRTSPISCRRSFAVTRYANTCFTKPHSYKPLNAPMKCFGSKYCVYSNQLHAFRTAWGRVRSRLSLS